MRDENKDKEAENKENKEENTLKKNEKSKGKKKHRFTLRKLIYNDKYLIVCSILAAVVIWVIVSMNLSPETTKTVSVPVSVDMTDTVAEQLGISYYETEDLTVQVTVSCKKYIARDITEDDLTASLQMNTITSAGFHSVPVSVTANSNADFTIENYYPTTVEGLFDTTETATFDIELNYVNTDFTAEGYVSGEASLSESSILVTGAKTYVSRVASVVADVELESGLTESQVIDLNPRAVDEDGNAVDYVTVNTTDAALTATVPVFKEMELEPSVNFVNGSAEAIGALKVSYSEKSVKVGALESANLTSLTLGDISFTEIGTGKNNFTFDLADIAGIVVLDGTESITVSVTLPNDYESKAIPFKAADVTLNVPKGYSAEVVSVSASKLNVIGASSVLKDITLSDISLSCDLTPAEGEEIEQGTATYNIGVVINDVSGCWVYGTYTITVNITK